MTGPPTSRDRFAGSEAWIADYASKSLEAYEQQFDRYLMRFRKLIRLYPGLRVLEVGAGSGWFMVLCQLRGFDCDGIEHNPIMVDAARERARGHGLVLSIRQESIETVELPNEEYDLVVAMSVLEHVQDYQRALSEIQQTLKPGGLFWGNSTNKFSLRSGEYPQVPLYGWLPYPLRRAIRVRRQGPGIVASAGMDFNQFTYFGIRKALRCAGFTKVYDRFDLIEPDEIVRRHPARLLAAHVLRAAPPLRMLPRIFDRGTTWAAVK